MTRSLEDLQQLIEQFVEERNWHKYHAPKNLASSIAIEAAELLELFQWVSEEESRKMVNNPKLKEAMASELADIMHYLLAFANSTGIDIEKAFLDKLNHNRTRFGKEMPDEQIKYKLDRYSID
ncbi:MAG: nucleotide pyrophosphohydrolase [Candidatus Kariarchaeaceae archaeon]